MHTWVVVVVLMGSCGAQHLVHTLTETFADGCRKGGQLCINSANKENTAFVIQLTEKMMVLK